MGFGYVKLPACGRQGNLLYFNNDYRLFAKPCVFRKKLIKQFAEVPKDLIWDEFTKVMAYFGFIELKTGKTGGSRRKFVDDNKNIISLHKPHPKNIVKRYTIEEAITVLKKLRYKL